jgi:hypothetical protein
MRKRGPRGGWDPAADRGQAAAACFLGNRRDVTTVGRGLPRLSGGLESERRYCMREARDGYEALELDAVLRGHAGMARLTEARAGARAPGGQGTTG